MYLKIRLSSQLRQTLIERLATAYVSGQLRLYRRIQALLYIVDGKPTAEVAELLHLAEQTVRNYVHSFILQTADSLRYRLPPGRPARLTKTQRKELASLITAGPEAAGFASACWTTPLVAELILQRFDIEYHPHYLAELLHELGFSYQKARFISDHLDAEARAAWLATTWPSILRQAQQQGALLLFGDEASFAQWGSLSYTWAPLGQQPTVKTCGKRKGYKVFGLIDYFSGRLFWKGQAARFNAESYQTFLSEVLAQTTQPIIVIQDGARYHTSQAMREFFALHTDRLTVCQLPSYSPDFNPIEYLWKKVKKQATHLKYFETFAALIDKVDQTMRQFTDLPAEILALMGRYCDSLGAEA
jgi:transposase